MASANRMTANPIKPSRYRPGKALPSSAESSDADSEDESPDEHEASKQAVRPPNPTTRAPPPPATSFPRQVTADLQNVDLGARRKQEAANELARKQEDARERERMEREAGFVTESSSGEPESESDRESASSQKAARPAHPRPQPSSSEGSSSDDESASSSSSSSSPPAKLTRPVFLKKSQRPTSPSANSDAHAARLAAETAARRQRDADALVQQRLQAEAENRAAARRQWDDDAEVAEEDAVDDTDGLDPELEHAQWVERELSRLKRGREGLERREAEIAEVERRRNMGTPEREEEDRAFVAEQERRRREGRGKMAYMQKYHHKGAFSGAGQGEEEDEATRRLRERNLMGARFVDQVGEGVRETLPGYLQERDLTRVGRKGRTRYKDMRSEDTGGFGGYVGGRRTGGDRARDGGRGGHGVDERFLPDAPTGPSGVNASAVGEKRKYATGQSAGSEYKRSRVD